MALTCRWHTPNAPIKAADPKIIKHTSAHEMDKFCIPVGVYSGGSRVEMTNIDLVKLERKALSKSANLCRK